MSRDVARRAAPIGGGDGPGAATRDGAPPTRRAASVARHGARGARRGVIGRAARARDARHVGCDACPHYCVHVRPWRVRRGVSAVAARRAPPAVRLAVHRAASGDPASALAPRDARKRADASARRRAARARRARVYVAALARGKARARRAPWPALRAPTTRRAPCPAHCRARAPRGTVRVSARCLAARARGARCAAASGSGSPPRRVGARARRAAWRGVARRRGTLIAPAAAARRRAPSVDV